MCLCKVNTCNARGVEAWCIGQGDWAVMNERKNERNDIDLTQTHAKAHRHKAKCRPAKRVMVNQRERGIVRGRGRGRGSFAKRASEVHGK